MEEYGSLYELCKKTMGEIEIKEKHRKKQRRFLKMKTIFRETFPTLLFSDLKIRKSVYMNEEQIQHQIISDDVRKQLEEDNMYWVKDYPHLHFIYPNTWIIQIEKNKFVNTCGYVHFKHKKNQNNYFWCYLKNAWEEEKKQENCGIS